MHPQPACVVCLTPRRLAFLPARPPVWDRPPLQQERPQYLYHFVLHAALDAVEEQEWATSSMHLGVVDRFNNYQVQGCRCGCGKGVREGDEVRPEGNSLPLGPAGQAGHAIDLPHPSPPLTPPHPTPGCRCLPTPPPGTSSSYCCMTAAGTSWSGPFSATCMSSTCGCGARAVASGADPAWLRPALIVAAPPRCWPAAYLC